MRAPPVLGSGNLAAKVGYGLPPASSAKSGSLMAGANNADSGSSNTCGSMPPKKNGKRRRSVPAAGVRPSALADAALRHAARKLRRAKRLIE